MSSQKDTLHIPLVKVQEIIEHLKTATKILKGEEGTTQIIPR